MYIEKYEIAPKLANLRGAVPCSKQGAIPAGMLIDGDTVTAVNEIMQISAKLPASMEHPTVLAAKTVALIESLPDGMISIESDEKDMVTIGAGTITSKQEGLTPVKWCFISVLRVQITP